MNHQRFLARCPKCGGQTTRSYLRAHGECKSCRIPPKEPAAGGQSERQARIIDSGWQAYATEEGHEG